MKLTLYKAWKTIWPFLKAIGKPDFYDYLQKQANEIATYREDINGQEVYLVMKALVEWAEHRGRPKKQPPTI